MPGTKKLGGDTAHRTAMLRGMVTFLLENGRIKITTIHAKEVRSLTEELTILTQENNLHGQRMALFPIAKEDMTYKLLSETAPEYTDRKDGYTRVAEIGPHRGDIAEMAIIELI